MAELSRIQLARRRLRTARRASVAIAASAFVGFAVAARLSHPGTASASSSSHASTATPSSDEGSYGSGFGFGESSIGPSSGSSSVQSGGS
jgi:hypothetical protein